MTRTHRDRLKKVLGHALRNVELAEDHILDLERVFKEQHPELAEELVSVLEGLEICLELLNHFSVRAWGYIVPLVERWRDTDTDEEED